MTDEGPLDLRSLADAESPDVVRRALRDFRRKAVTRYVWVLVVIVLAIVATLVYPPERGLDDRIMAADGAAVGHTFEVGASIWTLVRVADLGETLGLQFVVRTPPPTRAGPQWWVAFEGERGALGTSELGSRRADMRWLEVDKPGNGILAGEAWYDSGCVPPSGEHSCPSETLQLGSVRLDLPALGVLPSILED